MATPAELVEAQLKAALEYQSRYQYQGRLGYGGFGQVVLAADTWSRPPSLVAIKMLDRTQIRDRFRYIRGEIEHHAKLCHELVIQFKDVFLLPSWLCIVMEYASMGSLEDYLLATLRQDKKPFTEDIARYLFQQLIIAVDYCHRRKVASRDIKLANILLQPLPTGHLCVKLCDFGHSKAEDLSEAQSAVGTIVYMAPEVLAKRVHCRNPQISNSTYDSKLADVWSCGVVLYAMLHGSYPFMYDNRKPIEAAAQELLQKMMAADFLPSSYPVAVSKSCLELLHQMLMWEPHERIPLSAILTHPWFQKELPKEALSVNEACVKQQAHLPTQDIRDKICCIMDTAEAQMPSIQIR